MQPYPQTHPDLLQDVLQKLAWHRDNPSPLAPEPELFAQSMSNLFSEYSERQDDFYDSDPVLVDATANLVGALDTIHNTVH